MGYGGESDLAFEAGDIIRNDYVAYLNGYPATSPAAFAWASHQTSRSGFTRWCWTSTAPPSTAASPERATADIYHFANDKFHEAGFQGNVALAGHGVGAWWHQQEPYMVPSSNRVLEEGMVVALEPHIGPVWHLQDMVLVTADGAPRLLSPLFSTDEMLVAE